MTQNISPPTQLSRRAWLKYSLLGCSAWLSQNAQAMHYLNFPLFHLPVERSLTLHNLHTGEKLQRVFWANGEFITEHLQEFNHLLRDHRTGTAHNMSPDLLQRLFQLQCLLETTGKEIMVVSGYRSKKTNEMLYRSITGVSKNSLHMRGKAVDIRLPGVDMANLHKAAVALKAGGVGYYPERGFIHMDVGRVRYWKS